MRNGQLVTGRGVWPATVAVRGERIAAVVEPGARVLAEAELNARGLHILPGVIDPHVHTRHPGRPDREDFESGTAAAAAGGITTLLEMPISTIPTNSRTAVEQRVAAMQPGACVDFGLYGGAGEENLDAIAGQARAGVVAYKTFLQPPPPARLGEFTGLWSLDPARRRDVVRAVAATGLPHAFHCEDAPMYLALQQGLEAAGRLDGPAHAESRPPIVEEVSVAQVLALAAESGARPHIVHLSSPRSADLVRDARGRGVPATAETCPPYLFLTDEALATHGGFAKCNPPLRSASDVAGLWRHVASGLIDVIGTDHSPFLEEEKRWGAGNIFLAPPGLCGLELLVPLMLTAVRDGRLTLPDLARLLSERAAALFSLGNKGRLDAGADADLTLVDAGADWTFDHRRALTRSRANMRVFDGMRLRGRVAATLVRGTVVFRDGELTGRPGHGRFVRPAGRLSG